MPSIIKRVLTTALWALILATSVNAQAVFQGDVALSAPDVSRFGGLSAVEIADGGATALLLSDRGTLFNLRLVREDHAITAASIRHAAPITWSEGIHLPTNQRDSEGLAMLPDGTLAISFEGGPFARVALHGRDGVQIATLPAIPGAEALPRNGAFEGLAADVAGRFYTIPESMPGQGPIPLLRLENGVWTRFAALDRAPGWSPVALDFDDRGRLYVLERRASGLLAFSARLSRYELQASGLGTMQRLLQTPPGRHGNLEGLSVWRDGSGRLVASMVSDDNFLPILQMALVEYLLLD